MNIWLITLGLGFLFHGLLILWVGSLRIFRTKKPILKRLSQPFKYFADQYSYIDLLRSFDLALVALWRFY